MAETAVIDMDDIFGAPAPIIPAAATAPAVKPLVAPQRAIPQELLKSAYGGTIPATFTLEDATERVIYYMCDKLGIFFGVPSWIYHKIAAVSSTALKSYAALPSTARRPFIPGDDAAVGSGIHAFTLQGQEGLDEECAIMPIECEGRGKKAIAARDEFAIVNPDKVALPYRYGKDEDGDKPYIMDVLRGVDRSFRDHPKTSDILARSQKEVTILWVDAETGLLCKARLDIWADDRVIWDVKKCRSIDGFHWQIRELFYAVQAGWYFKGAVACGLGPIAFGFMPCEAFSPYRVGCGYRDPDKLVEDCLEAQRLLGLFKESTLTGYWPNFRPPPHIFSWADLKRDDLVELY